MTKTKPFAELAEKVKADPVRRERIAIGKRALEDALALAKLRAQQDKTQQEMAEILGVTQANISRIEHEEDLYLSTLRSYVAALGGELEVNAVFADGKVALVPARACYGLSASKGMRRWSSRQVKARKCSPTTVSGNRS
jgi:transcriptional regulator with XRE-family HTH domain